ncbi:hypothetical protein COCON_G00104460 [Conger conger]|uniref:Uncharacterized protein n=1 Tax=Conger conger TaxID=82655 RepID=A0A9Q1HZN1_CONCO|nr:hypothetical protein COCON_G00104460 [Conger conger]
MTHISHRRVYKERLGVPQKLTIGYQSYQTLQPRQLLLECLNVPGAPGAAGEGERQDGCLTESALLSGWGSDVRVTQT